MPNVRKHERLRHLTDIAAIRALAVSRRTFYRLLSDGVIDPPLARIAKNRRGWTIAEIDLAVEKYKEKKACSSLSAPTSAAE